MYPARANSPGILTNNVMVGKLDDISHLHALKEVSQYFQNNDSRKSKIGITFEDFKTISEGIPMLKNQDEMALSETFRSIDLDSSGYLNIREFRKFYSDMNLRRKTVILEPYPEKDLSQLKGLAFCQKYMYMSLETHETFLGMIFGPMIFILILFSVSCIFLATIPDLRG